MIMEQMVWSIPVWTCIAITVHFGFVANREVGWRPRSVVTYQVVSILTGLIAGLVGVGGGLILSPFFLLTGMDPATAVGTSATFSPTVSSCRSPLCMELYVPWLPLWGLGWST